jgi:biopolymer transport protein ExbD
MKFRPSNSPRSVGSRLQVTSMIDVIFLLLFFFMATTTFSNPEAHLTPGLREQRENAGRAADLEPQIVDVIHQNQQDAFRLGSRVFFDKASLTAALKVLPKEPGVFVRVSDDVSVAGVAAAMQACRDAGFIKVSYVPAP